MQCIWVPASHILDNILFYLLKSFVCRGEENKAFLWLLVKSIYSSISTASYTDHFPPPQIFCKVVWNPILKLWKFFVFFSSALVTIKRKIVGDSDTHWKLGEKILLVYYFENFKFFLLFSEKSGSRRIESIHKSTLSKKRCIYDSEFLFKLKSIKTSFSLLS